MTPYQLAEREGHEMVLGWSKNRVPGIAAGRVRTGGLVNRFFEYFASINLKSLRIGIVMESSCHVLLLQNVSNLKFTGNMQ